MQKRDINPKKTEKKKRGESMDIERYTEEKIRQEAEPDRGTEGKRMHDTPKGERESERERRRDIETAETSGDIGETLTPEERKRKAREKANKNLITTAQMTEDQRREFARIGGAHPQQHGSGKRMSGKCLTRFFQLHLRRKC